MTRQKAEKELKKKFGMEKFHDDQWKTIDLLLQGKRVLMIQRTGFGKSLCFQFPAMHFEGVTVVFSPLIALMRDQVKNLNERGIPARLINSDQSERINNQTLKEAVDGKIKILYIAPERQENKKWIAAAKNMELSMIVIDEAHAISSWGHDFRPAFRRIINLVNELPSELPVLAVTATATKRVEEDIKRQISGSTITIRGSMARPNLRLYSVTVKSEKEKYLWLAEKIPNLKGTGLVYTGTRENTELYSKWLNHSGIDSTAYHAGLSSKKRKEVEEGLMENRWKVIVSTNALGMGIDKPDIRFIIHTQIPESPIHYYQETGRAGRDGKEAQLILLFNDSTDKNGKEEDTRLPRFFINCGRPPVHAYVKVIESVRFGWKSEGEVLRSIKLHSSQFRVIRTDLLEQGILEEKVAKNRKLITLKKDTPELDSKPFEALRKQKFNDLDAMVEYAKSNHPRMAFLCSFLGDQSEVPKGSCDNSGLAKYDSQFKESTRVALARYLTEL